MATRTKKLTKSQTWEKLQGILNTTIMDNTKVKKGNDIKLIEELEAALAFLRPSTGGNNSTKINENGEVYCNYFGKYLPATEFATKLGKPNKITGKRNEVYKANCKAAEQIIRKVKALKNNCTKQVLTAFSSKLIDADEMQEHLANIDEACDSKYNSIEEIPKSVEVLGLTKAMGK